MANLSLVAFPLQGSTLVLKTCSRDLLLPLQFCPGVWEGHVGCKATCKMQSVSTEICCLLPVLRTVPALLQADGSISSEEAVNTLMKIMQAPRFAGCLCSCSVGFGPLRR